MLNLKPLSNITRPEVWLRGEDLYHQNAVLNLENDDETWFAEIQGTDLYNVSINIENNVITMWDCECLYDHSPVCKHVVALALEVENHLSIDPEEVFCRPKINVKDEAIDIDAIPANELKRFCKIYAADNPKFVNSLKRFLKD